MSSTDRPAYRIALVLVSHSAALAQGVAELAGQMAPEVTIRPAGGADDGGLGTSFDRITEALTGLPAAGSVVLYDLGSAVLTTETALEFLDPAEANRIEVVDAPLVEGALAAAVSAQNGGSRAEVAAAARTAGAATEPAPGALQPGSDSAATIEAQQIVELRNPLGLHARPAAELIRALADIDAQVSIARPGRPAVDARSLLAVVRLGARGGDQVSVTASGPDADRAVMLVQHLIEAGFDELSPVPNEQKSIIGAPGRAVGRLRRVAVGQLPERRADDPAAETRRLHTALQWAAMRLEGGDPLTRAHGALLVDPALRHRADAEIEHGWSAETAWWRAVEAESSSMAEDTDPIIAGRAIDVRDAGATVLTELGVQTDRVPVDADGLILLADELGPSEVTRFVERGGAGIVLTRGTSTAHAVVVARNLGLPLVLGARGLPDVTDGAVLAIDGTAGTIELDPASATQTAETIESDPDPVRVDGRSILVAANIGSVLEARAAVARGADGIGLLRTELLMLDQPELPDEEGQLADLLEILEVVGDRPVVIRVLDAGGDKPVRALALDPRHNGFLGVRGLRWLLANPAVLQTQLRAICRAAAGRRVSVMAPMVTLPGEAAQFVRAVEEAWQSLVKAGIPGRRPEHIGVMVEVPAAALAADEIGAEVDFLSIGTNDLLAYTMAADRTEGALAALLDPNATAIKRLLAQLCERAGVPVHVCGELAGDPDFAAWFVAHGVTELSMAAPRIPEIKRVLRLAR